MAAKRKSTMMSKSLKEKKIPTRIVISSDDQSQRVDRTTPNKRRPLKNVELGKTQRTLNFSDMDSDSDSERIVFKRRKQAKYKKAFVVESTMEKTRSGKGEGASSTSTNTYVKEKPELGRMVLRSSKSKSESRTETRPSSKKGKKHVPIEDVPIEAAILRKRKRSKKDEFPGIRTRSSPYQFFRCVRLLSDQQRLAVKEMGFGRLLHFNLDGIPAKLANHVVDSFNPERMEMYHQCGTINIDEETIQHLLGIPRNGTKFSSMTKIKPTAEAVRNWKNMYPGKFVRPVQMVNNIEASDGEDSFNFRMDFIMTFVTVMVDCHSQGCLRGWILKHITEETKFGEIDWCDLVIEKLKGCKRGWATRDINYHFVGPLAILVLMYVDCVRCIGMEVDYTVYPISFWSKEKLKEREKLEIVNGGFGIGPYKGLTCFENIIVDDEPSVEEKVTVIKKLMDVTVKNKRKIEEMLNSLDKEKCNNVVLQELSKEFEILFRGKSCSNRERDNDLASAQIKQVIQDIEVSDQVEGKAIEESVEDINEDCDESEDSLSDLSSPVVSLYRKSKSRADRKDAKEKAKDGQGKKAKHEQILEADDVVKVARNNVANSKVKSGIGEDDNVDAGTQVYRRKKLKCLGDKAERDQTEVVESEGVAGKGDTKVSTSSIILLVDEGISEVEVNCKSTPQTDDIGSPLSKPHGSSLETVGGMLNQVENVGERDNLDSEGAEPIKLPATMRSAIRKSIMLKLNAERAGKKLTTRNPAESEMTGERGINSEGGSTKQQVIASVLKTGLDRTSHSKSVKKVTFQVDDTQAQKQDKGGLLSKGLDHHVHQNVDTKFLVEDDLDDGPKWSLGLSREGEDDPIPKKGSDKKPQIVAGLLKKGLDIEADNKNLKKVTFQVEPPEAQKVVTKTSPEDDIDDGPKWSLGLSQEGEDHPAPKIDETPKPQPNRQDGNVTIVKWFYGNASSCGANEAKGDGSGKITVADPVSSFDPSTRVHTLHAGGAVAKTQQDARKIASTVEPTLECGLGVNLLDGVTNVDVGIWRYISKNEGVMYDLHGEYTKRKIMETNLLEQGIEACVGTASDPLATELLFRSPSNVVASRTMMKSLKVGSLVSDGIVDCWVEVLNYEQKINRVDGIRRLFVGTKAVFEWMLRDESCSEQLRRDKFKDSMKAAVYIDESMMDLRGVDLVLFPILELGHFYLLVFDLKNESIVVIDNVKQKRVVGIKDSYFYFHKDTVYKYKHMFVNYLEDVKHPKTNAMDAVNIMYRPVDWATTSNVIDCGVFLLRHMEKYKGLANEFDCGFSKNGQKKLTALKTLRQKFATHILLSDINCLKPKIMEALRN